MAQVYEFDGFRISPLSRMLWRGDVEVPLSGREFDTLWALVLRAGVPVSKSELAADIWGDANVSDNNLRQQIRSLRQKLGKDCSGNDYILTVPNRGYQLAAAVVPCPNGVESTLDKAVLVRSSGRFAESSSRVVVFAVLGVLLALLGGGVIAWRFWPTEVQLQTIRQLTRDGRMKYGSLAVLGGRVYFDESVGGRWVIASVPIRGGNVSCLKLPLASSTVLSASPVRHSLLVLDAEAGQLYDLQVDGLSLRQLPSPRDVTSALWSLNGHQLAVADQHSVTLFEPWGTAEPVRLNVPGMPHLSGWDPLDGCLRFDVFETTRNTGHFWEACGNERIARPLPPFSPNPMEFYGAWTSDGRFFAFEAGRTNETQIWIADAQTHRSYLLTIDARIWRRPTPVRSSKTIVALAHPAQGQLVTLPISGQAGIGKPVLRGVSGYELDYSRDGQWIAYTQYPEHTIWRCRLDGREARQLTPSGLVAHQPHWSPDGTRVAFIGWESGPQPHSRVYLVPSSGGNLNKPLPEGDDQGVPTWSPDGRTLVFGDLRTPVGFEHARVHVLDLRTRTLSTVASPIGMWSPRMSPNGRYLTAVSYDNRSVYIRDNQRKIWRNCATMGFVAEPIWPRNSAWIQFIGAVRAGHGLALFRISPACEEPRRITDLSTFEFAGDTWIGISPDGSPLGFSEAPNEIYALDWQLRRRFP